MRASSLAIAVALTLAACSASSVRSRVVAPSSGVGMAVSQEPKGPESTPAADYTYQLLTPQQTGLTQVFDDGRWTYVSFAVEAPVGLMIFDNDGRAVLFHAVGKTAVVDTIRQGWLIRTPTVSSYAQTREGAKTRAGLDAAALPVDLAAARAEILSDLGRLGAVSAELNRADRGAPSAPVGELKAQIDQIQTQLNGVNATLVRAVFPPGSAVLTISEETHQELLEAARQATLVKIRGGADSTGAAAANVRVALARAQTVQRLLIDGGVVPEKVSVSVGSQEYVASNATSEGRALNRRADVYFIGLTENAVTLKFPLNPESTSEVPVVSDAASRVVALGGVSRGVVPGR